MEETIQFGSQFTSVISLGSTDPDTGATTDIPADDITVTRDFEDPGVTIAITTSTVTISGAYQTILPITWHWLDLTNQMQTASTVPLSGTYSKIVQVDSPPFLTKDCIYTIGSSSTGTELVHTVTLGSFDVISNLLKTALAGTPP